MRPRRQRHRRAAPHRRHHAGTERPAALSQEIAMIEHKQIFIDGKWVDSSGTDVLTVINPVTEEPIATVPRGSAEDVDRAAQAAAKAFPELVAFPDRDARRDLQEARTPDRGALRSDHAHHRQRAGLSGRAGRQVTGCRRGGGAGPHRRQPCARSRWVEQVGNTKVYREPSGRAGRHHGLERAAALRDLEGRRGDGGGMHRRAASPPRSHR